ncbi:MAG: DNA primase [Microbacteriaceae bacterium]
MAGLIKRNDIDEVRARVNIADVLSEFVQLRNAGPGSMKGLCPFHDEKSPSFHVRTQNGRYHCFGCGEDGDVFTFLQKMNQISFSEAVERLAHRIGFELHYEDGGKAGVEQGSRARILAANKAAADFFVQQLNEPGAELGRQFLQERHFDQQAAAHFGVGFSPKSYDAMSKALLSQGFKAEELLAAGLTGQGDRGPYDRFRGRLMWPIRDVSGQIIGFGARKLFDDDTGPKYLNTPETSVYKKAQVLYGLDLARKDISRERQVVVVEGYTDVMACHLAGITTAVATCGTAFGSGHISMIRRLMGDDTIGMGEIVFLFDPDAAGQKAALRAFADEKRFSAQTYVAVPDAGLDPCDLRIQKGDEAVRQLINHKEPMFEFVIRQILSAHDLESVEGRAGALRAAAPIIAEIRDTSLIPGYNRLLAGQLGIEISDVADAVRLAEKQASRAIGPGPVATSLGFAPEGSRAAEDSSAERAPSNNHVITSLAETPVLPPQPSLRGMPVTPQTRLEVEVLAVLLQYPGHLDLERLASVLNAEFSLPPLNQVRDGLAAAIDHYKDADFVDRVTAAAPQVDLLSRELSVLPLPQAAGTKVHGYIMGITAALLQRQLETQKMERLARLTRAQANGDTVQVQQLQLELSALEQERRKFQHERG